MVRKTSDSSVRRSENCLRRRKTTRVRRSVSGNEKANEVDDESV